MIFIKNKKNSYKFNNKKKHTILKYNNITISTQPHSKKKKLNQAHTRIKILSKLTPYLASFYNPPDN